MRLLPPLLIILLVLVPEASTACLALQRPVEGPVLAGFAPLGRYAGHWGVDIGTPTGTVVRAPGPGRISFSGSVAGTNAVTVDHGGGLLTTVSSVAEHIARRGESVTGGLPLALSGEHDGRAAVHVSVRVDGRYVDPALVLGCIDRPPADALALVPVP